MSTNIWNGIFHSCSTKKLRPFWYYSHEISYGSTCMLMLGQPREVSLPPGRILPVPLGCSQRGFWVFFGAGLVPKWCRGFVVPAWERAGQRGCRPPVAGRGTAATPLAWGNNPSWRNKAGTPALLCLLCCFILRKWKKRLLEAAPASSAFLTL